MLANVKEIADDPFFPGHLFIGHTCAYAPHATGFSVIEDNRRFFVLEFSFLRGRKTRRFICTPRSICVPWRPGSGVQPRITEGIMLLRKNDLCASRSQYDRYNTCYMYPRELE